MHGLDNRAIAFGLFTLFTFLLTPQCAKALDNVTLITDFGYNGRHAYFFVAIEKGYYKDADLDVAINPGGPDVAPPQVIAGGGADVIVDWMPSALASREKFAALKEPPMNR